jgi:quercetin dioxygenase-like cupin family protein
VTVIIGPDDGAALPGTFEVVVKVRAEDTGGAVGIIEETVPPGAFVTPHTHENDVWVHVLSGEIGVLVGETIAVAPAGAWALKPRGVVHAMWNATDEPARIVEVLTPGGSERWFEVTSALAPGDREGFEEASRRYGVTFLPDSPWTAVIRDRFGL